MRHRPLTSLPSWSSLQSSTKPLMQNSMSEMQVQCWSSEQDLVGLTPAASEGEKRAKAARHKQAQEAIMTEVHAPEVEHTSSKRTASDMRALIRLNPPSTSTSHY